MRDSGEGSKKGGLDDKKIPGKIFSKSSFGDCRKIPRRDPTKVEVFSNENFAGGLTLKSAKGSFPCMATPPPQGPGLLLTRGSENTCLLNTKNICRWSPFHGGSSGVLLEGFSEPLSANCPGYAGGRPSKSAQASAQSPCQLLGPPPGSPWLNSRQVYPSFNAPSFRLPVHFSHNKRHAVLSITGIFSIPLKQRLFWLSATYHPGDYQGTSCAALMFV